MSDPETTTPDATAVAATAAAPGITAEVLSLDPEPTLEDLVGDGDGDEAPPAGARVLAELSTPEEEAAAATATSSYGFDRKLAEEGKWFRWPKLGPRARVLLRKTSCSSWRALLDRARERYGGEDGSIDGKTMDRIIEPMMAKSLFAGMEGVVVEVGAGDLADSVENRLRLLEMFSPDLRNELFKVCNSPKQFRDASEAVLGN